MWHFGASSLTQLFVFYEPVGNMVSRPLFIVSAQHVSVLDEDAALSCESKTWPGLESVFRQVAPMRSAVPRGAYLEPRGSGVSSIPSRQLPGPISSLTRQYESYSHRHCHGPRVSGTAVVSIAGHAQSINTYWAQTVIYATALINERHYLGGKSSGNILGARVMDYVMRGCSLACR